MKITSFSKCIFWLFSSLSIKSFILLYTRKSLCVSPSVIGLNLFPPCLFDIWYLYFSNIFFDNTSVKPCNLLVSGVSLIFQSNMAWVIGPLFNFSKYSSWSNGSGVLFIFLVSKIFLNLSKLTVCTKYSNLSFMFDFFVFFFVFCFVFCLVDFSVFFSDFFLVDFSDF